MQTSHKPRTAMPSASHNPTNLYQLQEGKYTATIYGMIRDARHQDVIKLLSNELQSFPRSRAALSLLGYCYFQVQDFGNATSW